MIHWTRIDSTGKVYFLFVNDLEKCPLMCTRGLKVVSVESTDLIHWTLHADSVLVWFHDDSALMWSGPVSS